jgi:hypothetical protein
VTSIICFGNLNNCILHKATIPLHKSIDMSVLHAMPVPDSKATLALSHDELQLRCFWGLRTACVPLQGHLHLSLLARMDGRLLCLHGIFVVTDEKGYCAVNDT